MKAFTFWVPIGIYSINVGDKYRERDSYLWEAERANVESGGWREKRRRRNFEGVRWDRGVSTKDFVLLKVSTEKAKAKAKSKGRSINQLYQQKQRLNVVVWG